MAKTFDKLAYNSLNDFVYGSAPNPVKTKHGLVIGGGAIYPELNFTLPPMEVTAANMPEIKQIYSEMIDGVLKRAVELHAPGLVVEFEMLPEMTLVPEWGIEVNNILVNAIAEYHAKYGLKGALRSTPGDVREFKRPPVQRSGEIYQNLLRTIEGSAKGGADFIAIETTGGKEVHDEALVNADLTKVIFALGIMGTRDMKFIWEKIVEISNANGAQAAGDTACGFANTAMVLAHKGFIPNVFAAVVRVASVARTLAAYEAGAVGPNKDCGYEGVYCKAITGSPIAMEGKSAACAHLSAVGNIAAAVADLWSNESVTNVRLLSDIAPVVSIEQLIYDCRLMNLAKEKGYGVTFRDLLADSDSKWDPQAYVLRPDVVLDISKDLIKAKTPFLRTKAGAKLAIDKIRKAVDNNEIIIAEREKPWLDIMDNQVEAIPDDEEKFWHEIKGELELDKFIPSEYELK
ncbi:MAG TPA: methyltransferase MtaB domain-containing protein [Methylomusa anaerophila]|uniref:Methanol-cobalamin methyltransferase B subunit n=1 Tax=Methylomusa anaerophila TaxID=1930071 RepID=A0A348AL64_9FIRM|nr:methyltransferase MtaB domain-containing protein [Methylomusa anaerophila]BBB91812.1 methanol-cobalamin methyltransferase B subunit [Methylomusa anaerophila]HML88454.1 methyltransferase MtaB domain-containing protein [Methylomusa anaerophila]